VSICILEQPPESPIFLHGVSRAEIRSFVAEHNRRVAAGEPLGWHEHLDTDRTTPFYGCKVISARVYSSFEDWKEGKSSGRAVKISDL